MRYVAAHYNVISSWDLVQALREQVPLAPRALIITFDDGYRCFLDTAFPILQRLGLPVTLFVPTGYPAAPTRLFWWDAIHRALMRTTRSEIAVPGLDIVPLTTPAKRHEGYARLVARIERTAEREAARLVDHVIEQCAVPPNDVNYMLNWAEVQALAAQGVAIGPHTRHHGILARAAPEQVRAEVAGSWADLQAHVPHPLPIFCYPNGKPHAVTRATARVVRQAGLVGAYTMVSGLNVVGRTDPYLLHRIGMDGCETIRQFTFKLTSAARLYRRFKRLISPAAAADFTFR
jgi:peptidoglycan/xylan/chitin deacetylase (PgdA/CDA1 family)